MMDEDRQQWREIPWSVGVVGSQGGAILKLNLKIRFPAR